MWTRHFYVSETKKWSWPFKRQQNWTFHTFGYDILYWKLRKRLPLKFLKQNSLLELRKWSNWLDCVRWFSMFDPLVVNDQSEIIFFPVIVFNRWLFCHLPILTAFLEQNLIDCVWNCIRRFFLRCRIEIVWVECLHDVRCYKILLDPIV